MILQLVTSIFPQTEFSGENRQKKKIIGLSDVVAFNTNSFWPE